MPQDIAIDILIYQQPRDPVGAPAENDIGSFWINTVSGAFFISRQYTPSGGELTREWFKEGVISETQFRQFFDRYAPLATSIQLRTGTAATRVSISPALLREAILAITPRPSDAVIDIFFPERNGAEAISQRAQARLEAFLRDVSRGEQQGTEDIIFQSGPTAIIQPVFPVVGDNGRVNYLNLPMGREIISIDLLISATPQEIVDTPHIVIYGWLRGTRAGRVAIRRLIRYDQYSAHDTPIFIRDELEAIEENETLELYVVRVTQAQLDVHAQRSGHDIDELVQHIVSNRAQYARGTIANVPGVSPSVLSCYSSLATQADLAALEADRGASVLRTINGVDDAQSFNPLDKLLVLQPIEEGRPTHSGLVNFSRETSDPVTIDQDNTPPDDFIQRTYDNRSGAASPNQTVYMLTTEGVVNAYTPQMQMEEGDAGPDLPDTPRRTLVLTDQNGSQIEGALFIDPVEPKIILLLPMDEFRLTLHFGTNRRVQSTYMQIPEASPGRIPAGFLKLRGESGYTEVGAYIFDILAPDRATLFPNGGTVNGMRLKITAFQSLVGGQFTGHLNLFLADLSFTNVVVGQEVKALPEGLLDERFNLKIESETSAVENRLHAEIDRLKEAIGDLQEDSFDMVLTSISVALSRAAFPAVGAQFNIVFFVKGVEHAPSGNFTATIDGQQLSVEQPSAIREGPNSLTVSIGSDAVRANALRNAGDGQADFQIRKGNAYSDILHVPIT